MAGINFRFAAVTEEEVLPMLTFLDCVVLLPSLFLLIQLFPLIALFALRMKDVIG